MKNTIFSIGALLTAFAISAVAAEKLYTYEFEQKSSPEECVQILEGKLAKLKTEFDIERFTKKNPKIEDVDFWLESGSDETVGEAYHSQGVCYIYIW